MVSIASWDLLRFATPGHSSHSEAPARYSGQQPLTLDANQVAVFLTTRGDSATAGGEAGPVDFSNDGVQDYPPYDAIDTDRLARIYALGLGFEFILGRNKASSRDETIFARYIAHVLLHEIGHVFGLVSSAHLFGTTHDWPLGSGFDDTPQHKPNRADCLMYYRADQVVFGELAPDEPLVEQPCDVNGEYLRRIGIWKP